MSGYNLPPGVRVSDIPGNTPDDEAFEAWCETCDETNEPDVYWCEGCAAGRAVPHRHAVVLDRNMWDHWHRWHKDGGE